MSVLSNFEIKDEILTFGKWKLPIVGHVKHFDKDLKSNALVLYCNSNFGTKWAVKVELMCQTAQKVDDVVALLIAAGVKNTDPIHADKKFGSGILGKYPWYIVHFDPDKKIEMVHFQSDKEIPLMHIPWGSTPPREYFETESELKHHIFGPPKGGSAQVHLQMFITLCRYLGDSAKRELDRPIQLLSAIADPNSYYTSEQADILSAAIEYIESRMACFSPAARRALLALAALSADFNADPRATDDWRNVRVI